jgi:hypothetical protein
MKHTTNKIMFLAVLSMVAFPFTTLASTILAVSFEDIVQKSELIFEGQVVTQETRRSKHDGAPFTYSTFQVLDVIKGRAPAGGYLTLGFAGGTIDGMTLEVHDFRMPVLNEKGIYFVESMDKELVNPLYGSQQGHYIVVEDAVTRVEKVMSVIRRKNELITAPTVNDFKRKIRSQLGGA